MTIDLRGLVRPQLVEATKREDNPNVAEFRLQPLERGFGHTLGNAMRRMLLSSLRGARSGAFRIDGVVHEHQTIPGVVEDVHQIIGNLKTLTLTLDRRRRERRAAHPARRRRRRSPPPTSRRRLGVRDRRSATTTCSRCRTIATSTSSCTSTRAAATSRPTSTRSIARCPVDLVRIDSIYNPVRRANFAVAETRVGQRTDYDRLTLTVETNGTITPEEAVSYAAALAQTHFQYFVGFGSQAPPMRATGRRREHGRRRQLHAAAHARRSTIFELSVRSVNSLKNSNIRTLGDLVVRARARLLRSRISARSRSRRSPICSSAKA